ncbi:ATP-binding protein [Rhizobium sp. BK251]|uniref:sensor histidine kinase n=1 Tax=Rhizobium sp. BK251 TaxID=2512125 RepID=UPI001044BA97|nr:ATP-binding protein [Rhizobium sp. BK251]TCL67190.1 PAS domain S-box-containing protein [Rhizobium sp. BK251]
MQTGQSQAQDSAALSATVPERALPMICIAITAAIFILDAVTTAEIVVAMLYVGVVLMAARFLPKRGILFVALACAVLTVLAYFVAEPGGLPSATLWNRVLSLAAIGIAAFLAVQSQSRERVLREQARLLDLTHDTIFVRDMNDVITYWNRGAEQLYGLKKEEAVGKVTHQLLQTSFPMPLEEITVELLRTGRWEGELVHTKKNGTQATVMSRWSVRRDARDRPVAILETNNDITERKRAEEALRETQTELAHVSRVTTLGEMTASIAHEVAQPLAAALINANTGLRWLGSDPPDVEGARKALGRIIHNAGLARDILDRIRALVRKSPPRQDRFDLTDAVLDVIALSRSAVQKHGVSLQTELAPDLPAVGGDRVQVQQVMLNLILNAVEAMSGLDDGAREVLVSTKTDASGQVGVVVRDTGPGLEPQAAARVFEAFYTTKPEGLGMGLSICRSIIEAHGGQLWGSPNEPRGAVFQFTLPPERGGTVPAKGADRPSVA